MAQSKTTRAEFDAKIASVSEVNWARLSAYIDGEGTVMIQRSVVKTGRKNPNYVLVLIVANTDLRLMEWLTRTFAGNVYFSHSVSRRQWSKKVCHTWRCFEDRASTILEHCLPYMIMKKQQAEIGIAYRELRKLGSKGRKLTPGDIQARDEYYKQIRVLNSGVSPDADRG